MQGVGTGLQLNRIAVAVRIPLRHDIACLIENLQVCTGDFRTVDILFGNLDILVGIVVNHGYNVVVTAADDSSRSRHLAVRANREVDGGRNDITSGCRDFFEYIVTGL